MTNTTAPTKQFGPAKKEAWQLAVMSREDISAARKLVLVALSTYANSDTGMAWPSAGTLAKMTNSTLSVAQRALRDGENVGLLVTVEKGRKKDNGADIPSKRRLIVPAKADTTDTAEADNSEGGTAVVPQGYSTSAIGVQQQRHRGYGTSAHQTSYTTPDRTSEKNLNTVNDVDDATPPVKHSPNDYTTTEPQPLAYFLDEVELRRRWQFKRYLKKVDPDADYDEQLDGFKDTMTDQNRRDWEATFLAFLKDDREWT
ncbi:helix-turn-helix domain-containing protein [Corynebacterium glyciniphilum]|uniref:helix-turn-helix domain-containing protein n=1 Tax=Corynebacterium glyciniphilum TaxID=1404244 RepID=UPI002653F992|nr:helix-turn-helix domain-containing protein [Corynebacterium glyciniphilum]MDN6705121.1 helix-turn-helix domain-containing protein [Corynebacterium glyciniphilum]